MRSQAAAVLKAQGGPARTGPAMSEGPCLTMHGHQAWVAGRSPAQRIHHLGEETDAPPLRNRISCRWTTPGIPTQIAPSATGMDSTLRDRAARPGRVPPSCPLPESPAHGAGPAWARGTTVAAPPLAAPARSSNHSRHRPYIEGIFHRQVFSNQKPSMP